MRLDSNRVLVPATLVGAVLAVAAGTLLAHATQGGRPAAVAARPAQATKAPGIYPLPASAAPSTSAPSVERSTGASAVPPVGFTTRPAVRPRATPQDPWAAPPPTATAPPASDPSTASGPTLFDSGGTQPTTTTDATTTTTPATATTTTPAPAPSPPPPLEVSDVRELSLTASAATIAWRTSEAVSSRVAYGVDRPTLWTPADAPSTEHVATLTGLAYGTSYGFAVDARAADGRTAWAPFVLQTPELGDAITTGTGGGAFLLHGQPFFPTIVWKACADSYDTLFAAGIDLFMGNGCGSAHDQLAKLGGRALSLADARGPAVSGRGLAGSFLPDEWDLRLPGSLSFAEAASLAATSTTGPRFLTLSNHFYSRADPLPQGRALYPALAANAEVLGFDLYPLQSWCRWDSFGDVFAAQQELVELARGKPTFQWIETRTMDCDDARLAPTPDTVRAETWLAIAGGAHAIGYFPNDWSPEIGAEIAREKREIETLAPALAEPALPARTAGPFVKVGAREHNGAVYVIAVNASRSPVTDTIDVPALGERRLVSVDGTRAVTPAGGSFTDTFAPLDVHVYVAPPTG